MDAEAEMQGLRILIVDDHEVIRGGLKRILSSTPEGWRIENGFLALDRLREQEFELAIVDLTMPGMGGLEFVKRIPTEFPRLAVMVLSMHPEEQYALRALKAGRAAMSRKTALGPSSSRPCGKWSTVVLTSRPVWQSGWCCNSREQRRRHAKNCSRTANWKCYAAWSKANV